jgi:NAD(P)-dependent dehydrogenase (short-subunit alcohol dehydrogenase family)
METWRGTAALITGGGSGIGRALARALAQRGAHTYVADLDFAAARAVAGECGAGATALELDVRDPARFRACVDEVVGAHGRIDYLFNVAGIGVSGEAHEIPLEAWDRIIDVNVRGVVNGIAAAYPRMVAQGSGHIVNTASLAGLVATPLLTPYAMSKHAIVGLSTSLREEAAGLGVRVSVLCPAAVETPMLDADNPRDVPAIPWRPDTRRFLAKLSGKPYPVEALVEDALAAVSRNVGTIVVPGKARLVWRLARSLPGLVTRTTQRVLSEERALRSQPPLEK